MTNSTPDLRTPAAQGDANEKTVLQSAEDAVDKARGAMSAGMESGRQAIEGAREAMDAGVHVAQEKVGEAIGMAREAASQVSSSVSEAASYAGRKAEAATSSVGGAMESTGHYLKEDGLHHIASDVTELIRRNPVPAMLIGIGLGFLLAQVSTRRNA